MLWSQLIAQCLDNFKTKMIKSATSESMHLLYIDESMHLLYIERMEKDLIQLITDIYGKSAVEVESSSKLTLTLNQYSQEQLTQFEAKFNTFDFLKNILTAEMFRVFCKEELQEKLCDLRAAIQDSIAKKKKSTLNPQSLVAEVKQEDAIPATQNAVVQSIAAHPDLAENKTVDLPLEKTSIQESPVPEDCVTLELDTKNLKSKAIYGLFIKLRRKADIHEVISNCGIPIVEPLEASLADLTRSNREILITYQANRVRKENGVKCFKMSASVLAEEGVMEHFYLEEKIDDLLKERSQTRDPQHLMQYLESFQGTKQQLISLPHITLDNRRQYLIKCSPDYWPVYEIWEMRGALYNQREMLVYRSIESPPIDFSKINRLTKLHEAAKEGNLEDILYYAKNPLFNTYLNDKDSDGSTAAHLATSNGHLNVLAHLIQEKADINITNQAGLTPLQMAIHHDKGSPIAKLLLQTALDKVKKDKVDKVKIDKMTLASDTLKTSKLHAAAHQGNLGAVKTAIKLNPLCLNGAINGYTPLAMAVLGSQMEMIKYLLDLKADIHFSNTTILHTAVFLDDTTLVKYLCLRRDLNINVLNSVGQTALHIAVEKDLLEMVHILVEMGSATINKQISDDHDHKIMSPLDYALFNKNRPIAEYLTKMALQNLDNRLNSLVVGMYEEKKDPAKLAIAAKQGDLLAVQAMFASKMDFAQKDKKERTLLHLAAMHHQLPVVKYLIEVVNLSPNEVDKHNRTPLDHAQFNQTRGNDRTALIAYLQSKIFAKSDLINDNKQNKIEPTQLAKELPKKLQPHIPYKEKFHQKKKTRSLFSENTPETEITITNDATETDEPAIEVQNPQPVSSTIIRERLTARDLPVKYESVMLAEENTAKKILNYQRTHLNEDSEFKAGDPKNNSHEKLSRNQRRHRNKKKPAQFNHLFFTSYTSAKRISAQSTYLQYAYQHLERLGMIYFQINDEEKTSSQDQNYENFIIHYALHRNITRCFVALKRYKELQGPLAGVMDKDLIVDVRNMQGHCRADNWSRAQLFEMAQELVKLLPKDFCQTLKAHTELHTAAMITLNKDQIATLSNLFGFKTPEVDNLTDTYEITTARYNEKAQSNESLSEAAFLKSSLADVHEKLIPKINFIMRRIAKPYQETGGLKLHLDKIVQDFPQEIDALYTLLADCGRETSDERASSYLKDLSSAQEQSFTKQLIQFVTRTRNMIRNQEDHDFPEASIEDVLDLCEEGNKLNNEIAELNNQAHSLLTGKHVTLAPLSTLR